MDCFKKTWKKNLIIIRLTTVLLLFATVISSQTTSVKISQMRFYYDDVRYEDAISTGQEILEKSAEFSIDQLAFVHQYLGLAFFNIGQQDSARSHFLSWLSIDPQASLDPVTTSPKIVAFLEETRSKQLMPVPKSEVSFSHYLIRQDPRPSATWRSMLLPGWGQSYKGQKTRAMIIGGAFISAAGAAGVAWWQESRSHDRYLDSMTPEDIASNYDTYNSWYKTRRNLTIVAISAWAIAAADALWYAGGTPQANVSQQGHLQLGMRWKW